MKQRLKWTIDGLCHPWYVLRGRQPWKLGYLTAKRRAISKAIDQGVFSSAAPLPDGYGFRIDERIIEYPWLFSRLPAGDGLMLDAGSALNHGYLVDRSPLNEKRLVVDTLAPEDRCFWAQGVGYIFEDLRDSIFRDECFDVVASVSTIEHIGLDNTMLYTDDPSKAESDPASYLVAVMEFKRVLKTGGPCFLTVPYGRRGVHRWFQVFDAAMVAGLIEAFAPASSVVEYFGYQGTGWQRVEPEAIADATFFDVHSRKGFDPDFAAFARGVACIELIK
jgi:SAM-dependent methyltransferase